MTTGSEDRTASPPVVALTGFMAAGKSTVSRALATLLHWRCIDLDWEIERRERRAVREIFKLYGENRFRRMETDALRSILDKLSVPTVIALGGGTFAQPENAKLLQIYGARVVFLRADLERLLLRCQTAGQRCGENPRPLAQDEAAFRALYEKRLASYNTADLTVNTEADKPEECARRIAEQLSLSPPEP